MSAFSSDAGTKKPATDSPAYSDAALTDNHTADAEVAMQIRYLLLVPVLALIAGCSEKIEAPESSSETGKIIMPPEQNSEAPKAPEEHKADLKLHSPVGLD